MNYEIAAENGGYIFQPAVCGEVRLESYRRGRASRLTFSYVDTGEKEKFKLAEGCGVSLKIDGKGAFFGYVFSRKRSGDNSVSVIAYDQLRYLKNKDTYVYENKRVCELLRLIAADYRLKTGIIGNTAYVIPARVEDNISLLDMIENALDLEYANTGKRYVVFDDCGKLSLKSADEMYTGIVISRDCVREFSYSSSIEKRFNKIKLSHLNRKTGRRDIFIAEDSVSGKNLGILQYYSKIGDGEDGYKKARSLLSVYNKNDCRLSVTGAFGAAEVRGGSGVEVNLDLGENVVKKRMTVEECKHRFLPNGHFMDLRLEDL